MSRKSDREIERRVSPEARHIIRAFQRANRTLRPMIREMRRDGIIPGYPPQHNYRQTRRGRVTRLSPAMRARKRELRERRGR